MKTPYEDLPERFANAILIHVQIKDNLSSLNYNSSNSLYRLTLNLRTKFYYKLRINTLPTNCLKNTANDHNHMINY